MAHRYRKEIISILSRKVGKGVSLATIARYVYNERVSLFSAEEITYPMIYSRVSQYLSAQSQKEDSIIIRCERRGYYALKKRNKELAFL